MKILAKALLLLIVFSLAFVVCSCEEKRLAISFVSDYGDNLSSCTIAVYEGETIKREMIPMDILSKDGEFSYWAYDENGDNPWNMNEPFYEDTTLYAIYKPIDEEDNSKLDGIVDIDSLFD